MVHGVELVGEVLSPFGSVFGVPAVVILLFSVVVDRLALGTLSIGVISGVTWLLLIVVTSLLWVAVDDGSSMTCVGELELGASTVDGIIGSLTTALANSTAIKLYTTNVDRTSSIPLTAA